MPCLAIRALTLRTLVWKFFGDDEWGFWFVWSFYILDSFLHKLHRSTLFFPSVKLLQFVPWKSRKYLSVKPPPKPKCFVTGITYSDILLKWLFDMIFFSGVFAPSWFMAALWDGAEIKLLYTVQTINSILNLAASGGKWRGRAGEGKLRWSHIKCCAC